MLELGEAIRMSAAHSAHCNDIHLCLPANNTLATLLQNSFFGVKEPALPPLAALLVLATSPCTSACVLHVTDVTHMPT